MQEIFPETAERIEEWKSQPTVVGILLCSGAIIAAVFLLDSMQ